MCAAASGSEDIVKVLIESGAQVDAVRVCDNQACLNSTPCTVPTVQIHNTMSWTHVPLHPMWTGMVYITYTIQYLLGVGIHMTIFHVKIYAYILQANTKYLQCMHMNAHIIRRRTNLHYSNGCVYS